MITEGLREIRRITPSDQVVVLRFYASGDYVLEFEKDTSLYQMTLKTL